MMRGMKKRLSVDLDADVHAVLVERAWDNRETVSDLIRRAVTAEIGPVERVVLVGTQELFGVKHD